MKRILFVDDEPKILDGLRRMLRGLRDQWEMEFVDSGPEALQRLAAWPADVVVTDMRMPGMDGAELLDELMRRHPRTVRIVLSGQCEREAVLKAVGPAHQFLTKPCDPEVLKASLTRICKLRDRLPGACLQGLVCCAHSVPSAVRAYVAWVEELQTPNPSLERLADIASSDVGIAATLVQLVSSGFFGSPQRLVEPALAVKLLGIETLHGLVQSGRAFCAFSGDEQETALFEVLHQHSTAVAQAARRLAAAETTDPVLVSHAYVAGLLHAVGIALLSQPDPTRYLRVLDAARREPLTLQEAERQEFGATAQEIGAYLMGLWGAPEPIVAAIEGLLDPSQTAAEGFSPLTAVHVAAIVLAENLPDILVQVPPMDLDHLQSIGCADRVAKWQALCRAQQPGGVLA